jgi:hypothetical protein
MKIKGRHEITEIEVAGSDRNRCGMNCGGYKAKIVAAFFCCTGGM